MYTDLSQWKGVKSEAGDGEASTKYCLQSTMNSISMMTSRLSTIEDVNLKGVDL